MKTSQSAECLRAPGDPFLTMFKATSNEVGQGGTQLQVLTTTFCSL